MTSFVTLADERFVSLTTFRRSGQPVPTPMWVSRDGEAIVMLTPAGSGKVKRLRHDPRVEIWPCGRFGKVPRGAQPVAGIAELREQPADVERVRALIRSAYPFESRVWLGAERLIELLRGRAPTPRLGLYIREAPSDI